MLMTRGPNFTKPPPPELASASDADRALAERMAATMRSVIESGRYKPPILPEVAVRLSHLANEPEARIEDVESAVSRDPAVAGKVVSVANSALNARGMAVTSLRGSIMRLGIFQIRDIAFQVVANARLFKVPAYNPRMKELLESSQAAGVMAREVGKVRGAEIEAAYLCGLLHDIGEVTILAILGDAAKAKNEQPPPLSKLALVIDAYHAQVGGWLCRYWKLADSIVESVVDHHHPERSTCPTKMAYVLALTDRLLAHAGIGRPAVALTKEVGLPLLEALSIPTSRAPELLRFAEAMAANRDTWAL